MKKLPQNWPAELKRELSTPIANEALVEIERNRKVSLLARYYIDYDQIDRWKKQGKTVGRDDVWALLVHRLLADVFPAGFNARKRKKRGSRVRTVGNDAILVFRVQTTVDHRKITESAAVRAVYRKHVVYQEDEDEESTLRTRYKEAKHRPEVIRAVNMLRDLERGQPFEGDFPGYGKAMAEVLLAGILGNPAVR